MEALSPMGETIMDTSVLSSPQSSHMMMGMGEESMDTLVMSPRTSDPNEINEKSENIVQSAPAPVFTQQSFAASPGLQSSFTGCLSNMVLPGLPNAGAGTTPILLNATSPTTVAAPFLLNQSTFTTAPANAPQFLVNTNTNPNTTFFLNPGTGNMQTFLLNPNVGATGAPLVVQTPVTNTTSFFVNSGMFNTSPNTLLLTHPGLTGSNSTLMLTTNHGATTLQQIPQPAPAPMAEAVMDAANEIQVQATASDGSIQLQTVQLPVSLPSGAVLPPEAAQNILLQNMVPQRQRSDSRSSSTSLSELEQGIVEENSLTENMEENKDMLALRLKLRRPREELVNQGIMPPLKTTPAFHEQRQRLERAKVGDSLQRKMRMRPDKAQLVHQHILEDTNMEPMVSATHQRLKRARIEQDLDSKIKNRPGPLELIEGNILKAEHFVEQAVKDGKVHFLKTSEIDPCDTSPYNFDEDSTEVCSDEPMSPSQPYSQQSDNPPSSVGSIPSPPDFVSYFDHHQQMIPHCITSSSQTQTMIPSTAPSITIKQEPNLTSPPTVVSLSNVSSSSPSSSKSGGSSSSSKNARKKQTKRNKPKEIKFHEYKPPNEQTSKLAIPPNSSNPYNLLLMQQQLLLQLQLLQQQHHQLILPNNTSMSAPSKLSPNNPNVQSPSSTTVTSSSSPTPQQDTKPTMTITKTKILTNLEDMKVSELKMELKNRGLHVSGTKPQLVERLRPYVDVSTSPCSTATSAGQDVTSSTICSTAGGTKVTSSTDVTQDAVSETNSNRASMSSPPVSPPDFKSPVSVASETSDPASPGSAFEPNSPTFQMVPPPSVTHSTSTLPVSSPPVIFSQSSEVHQHQTTMSSICSSPLSSQQLMSMDSTETANAIAAEIRDMKYGDMQVSNEILRKQQQRIEELQRALQYSQLQLHQHQTKILPPPPPPPPPHPAAVASATGMSPPSNSPIKLASLNHSGAPPMTIPSTISPPTSLPVSITPPQMQQTTPVKSPSPPRQQAMSPIFQPPDFLSSLNQQGGFSFTSPLPNGQPFRFTAKAAPETKPTPVTNGILPGQKSSSVPSSPTETGAGVLGLGVLPSYTSPPPNYEEAVRQTKERKAQFGSLLSPGSTETGEQRMTQSQDLDDLLEVLVDHGYQIPVTPKAKDMVQVSGRLPTHVASMPNLSLALATSTNNGAKPAPSLAPSLAPSMSLTTTSMSQPQLHHNQSLPPPPPHPQQQQQQQHHQHQQQYQQHQQEQCNPPTPMSIPQVSSAPSPSPIDLPMDVDSEMGFPGLDLSKSLPQSSHHDLPPKHDHRHHQQQASGVGMLSTSVPTPSGAMSADKDNGNLLPFDLPPVMQVDGERDAGFWLGGDDPSPSAGMLGQPAPSDSDMNWLEVMMSSSGSGLTPGNATPPSSIGAEGSLGTPLGKESFSLNLFDINDDAWDNIHVTE